jgi:hypothetical protein
MSHMPELPVCTYDFRRLFTLLSLFGAAVALVRRERIGLMFVAVILVLTVLSALHLYLLGEGRYSAYLLPFLVLLGGRSVQAVVTALRPLRARFPVRVTLEARLAKQVALLLLVGFSLACFVRNSAWFLRVGALPYAALAAADAARPDAIVPLGLGQPQVDLVRSHSHLSTRRFVEVNPTEAARLSDEEIQRHPPDLFEEPGAWPLVMRAEQVRLGWLDTTTPLRIDDYFGWIQQQAELLHRVVFIAPTCMALPDSHLGRLMQGLAQTGTIRELDTTPCYSTVLWTQADTMPGASTPGSRP